VFQPLPLGFQPLSLELLVLGVALADELGVSDGVLLDFGSLSSSLARRTVSKACRCSSEATSAEGSLRKVCGVVGLVTGLGCVMAEDLLDVEEIELEGVLTGGPEDDNAGVGVSSALGVTFEDMSFAGFIAMLERGLLEGAAATLFGVLAGACMLVTGDFGVWFEAEMWS
jgi:hypothetical protein